MGSFTKGEIVLVPFPFSDLSSAKLRPALVICNADFNDILLCQITSKRYDDRKAIEVQPSDCRGGSLDTISYIRPLKMFTADSDIVVRNVCSVSDKIFTKTRKTITELINQG